MGSSTSHRPEGLGDVTPYLIVPDADRLIAFLQEAFGAAVVMRVEDEQGRVRHAQLRIGDSAIELGQSGDEWKAAPCALHHYVPDVEAVYAAALKAGAESLYPPTERDYGDREAGVRDPGGNQWFLATHLGAAASSG